MQKRLEEGLKEDFYRSGRKRTKQIRKKIRARKWQENDGEITGNVGKLNKKLGKTTIEIEENQGKKSLVRPLKTKSSQKMRLFFIKKGEKGNVNLQILYKPGLAPPLLGVEDGRDVIVLPDQHF